jgi:hypothetical protein
LKGRKRRSVAWLRQLLEKAKVSTAAHPQDSGMSFKFKQEKD